MNPTNATTPVKPYAGRRIHFVGIGGCGMCGLAEFVLAEGGTVSGSDRTESETVQRLRRLGATVFIGHAGEHLPEGVERVVASAAVPADNPELAEALRRGVPVDKYARFLGRLMDLRQGIAVSGTHGKSTTTAMTAFVLRRAGLDPSFVIGADVPQLGGGSSVGAGPHLVVEACEYDRSFLALAPRAATILNIEEDHLDYYKDLAEIRGAFADFAARVPAGGLLVLGGTDLAAPQMARSTSAAVETFGLGGQWDWRAENLEADRGRFAFDAYHGKDLYGTVRLSVPGQHQVLNALAAMALSRWAGAPREAVLEALGAFEGARRRTEVLGRAAGVTVVDDYAHHPTEIVATLKAVRQCFEPKRLWVVFQPHQYSRTRFLLKDFARALALADKTIVPDIYFVRDSENERQAVRSQDLVGEIQSLGADALYIESFDLIRRYLVESLAAGDVLLVMGAGDVWRLGRPLLEDLGQGPRAKADQPAGRTNREGT
ncbi:MAG TPA: UDP-N-acetylmuramate--L-alanine ligase [Phycisphaerae bacterium]|nr:UDP-N-acetylmuramate--L-alanine ligase [Phycisphaerae bacterium]